jgi:hypothetical protein
MTNSEKNVSMLEDNDWLNFLKLIRKGKCTPFMGAGPCVGVLPLATHPEKEHMKLEHKEHGGPSGVS